MHIIVPQPGSGVRPKMGTAHDFKSEMTIIAGNSISTVAETKIFMQSVKTFKQSNKKTTTTTTQGRERVRDGDFLTHYLSVNSHGCQQSGKTSPSQDCSSHPAQEVQVLRLEGCHKSISKVSKKKIQRGAEFPNENTSVVCTSFQRVL